MSKNTILLEDKLTDFCNKVIYDKVIWHSSTLNVFCFEDTSGAFARIEICFRFVRKHNIKSMRKLSIEKLIKELDRVFNIRKDMIIEEFYDGPVNYNDFYYSNCRLTYDIPIDLYYAIVVYNKIAGV